MPDKNKYFCGAISAFVITLAAQWFWPSQHTLELVSPDGSHRMTLSATNTGAKIVLHGGDSGEIVISTMRHNPATIEMNGKSASAFRAPHIVLADNENVRIIKSE